MKPPTKGKTILALIAVYMLVVVGWNWSWPWGILFILWTIPAFYSGRTHLVEEVDRDEHPVLFWWIVCTWILLSLLLIVSDLWQLF